MICMWVVYFMMLRRICHFTQLLICFIQIGWGNWSFDEVLWYWLCCICVEYDYLHSR